MSLLELPYRVVPDDEGVSPTHGRFRIDPFEIGLGAVVGNSLRRILLSSIEGAAVTLVRFTNVPHEFAVLGAAHEDVQDIIANLRLIRVRVEAPGSQVLNLHVEQRGQVTAGQISVPPGVTILNPEQPLCTLAEDVPLKAEITVRRGRGYLSADDNTGDPDEWGLIRVNSDFSPVSRVRYVTEPAILRGSEAYERLVLEIWTNGVVSPDVALMEAAGIMRKHLQPFMRFGDRDKAYTIDERAEKRRRQVESEAEELQRKLNLSVEELDLSVRSRNCLEREQIRTLGQLVCRQESDMIKVRSFGKTSIREVKAKLAEFNLRFGMDISTS